jgi:hypothetical protein
MKLVAPSVHVLWRKRRGTPDLPPMQWLVKVLRSHLAGGDSGAWTRTTSAAYSVASSARSSAVRSTQTPSPGSRGDVLWRPAGLHQQNQEP